MSRGLDGTNPRSYVGVRPLTPPNMIIPGIRPTSLPRDPTQNDIQYNLGDMWLNTNTEGLWYLAALGSHLVGGINTRFATWLQFGLGNGTVKTLTGDTGGPVGPDVNGNINTLGTANNITVAGNPGTNTLVWDVGSHIATSYPTDNGTAVPSGNVLNIITNNAAVDAGSSVLFSGSGNTVQLNVTDSDSNTLVGKNSGNLTLSGAGNTGLGGGALFNLSSGDANTAVGLNALQGVSTGSDNTAVGNTALQLLGAGGLNTAVGQEAMQAATTAIANVAVGATSLSALTTGQNNVGVGFAALASLVTGNGNTAIGDQAGSSLTAGDTNNVCINHDGIAGSGGKWFFSLGNAGNLFSHNYGTQNVFLGELAGNLTMTGGGTNVGIGYNALNANTTGAGNVAIGNGALDSNTSGGPAVAIGSGALTACTTGGANVAVGFQCGEDLTTGNFNAAVGSSCMTDVTTGTNNVAMGYLALSSITTGSFNTALGQEAGDGLTTSDSSNICINNTGTVGDNNTLRIGAGAGAGSGQLNRAFIHGIRGITTGVNDAIAVLIDSAGQLGTVSSSIRFKENIEDMGDYSSPIHGLRPVTFNYKKNSCERKSVGLIAEEVGEVMPDLVVFDNEGFCETVRYNDLVPMLLNEVQKMKIEIQQLQAALNK